MLSTHANRQGVDISVTACFFFVCVFVRLRISLPRIKLEASNFAQWLISVLGRESHILGNFAPPEAQNIVLKCRHVSLTAVDMLLVEAAAVSCSDFEPTRLRGNYRSTF